jgi:type III pantothenate kinase
MHVAIDIGNTNITFAVFTEKRIIASWRSATDARKTADDYAVWITQLMALRGLTLEQLEKAIVVSVVPEMNFPIRQFCREYLRCEPLLISEDKSLVDIPITTSNPKEIGADRLVNAIAARHHYGVPSIVVDFGTATTFDVIDAQGAYCGGVIAPGPNLSLQALYSAAAKLPRIAIEKPPHVIGRSTIDAMQSGVFWGYVGLVQSILTRIQDEAGIQYKVIATGGLAPLFKAHMPDLQYHDEDLTIKGLLAIFEQQQQRNTT